MIVSLTPSASQVRWYVKQAINGFETLDRETAISEAVASLESLLAYLTAIDRANDAIPVFLIKRGKAGIGCEVIQRTRKT